MKKIKAVLAISVIYEDFSLTPEGIRKIVGDNLTYLINRGMLTEELSATVEDWSTSFDFKPQELTMATVIYLKVIYEAPEIEREGLEANLRGLADYAASRGYLSNDYSVVKEWDYKVNSQII